MYSQSRQFTKEISELKQKLQVAENASSAAQHEVETLKKKVETAKADSGRVAEAMRVLQLEQTDAQRQTREATALAAAMKEKEEALVRREAAAKKTTEALCFSSNIAKMAQATGSRNRLEHHHHQRPPYPTASLTSSHLLDFKPHPPSDHKHNGINTALHTSTMRTTASRPPHFTPNTHRLQRHDFRSIERSEVCQTSGTRHMSACMHVGMHEYVKRYD